MVKFVMIGDFCPEQIEFLKDRYKVIGSSDDTIYETDDKFIDDLRVLEKAGMLKIIRENPTHGVIYSLELLDILIDKVEKKAGDPVFYYVYIEDYPIRFTSSEFISQRRWKEKLIAIDIVIGDRRKQGKSSITFDEFIQGLLNRATVVWKDTESEEDIYANIVISEIGKLVEVKDWDDFVYNPRSFIVEDKAMIVKSSTINEILNQKHLNMTLTKLREILRPYLLKNSEQKWIKDHRSSIWFFKGEENK